MKIGNSSPLSLEEKARLVAECVENFNLYLNRWPEPRATEGAVVEWEGEGCFVRDIEGREFLDCLGGFGIFALGHRHPKVIGAIKVQLDRLALHSQWMLNPMAADAARRLAEITPGQLRKTFWCSSGTEAVEGALKLARLYTGKQKYVSTVNSFHGKTMGSLSVTGRELFRKPFEPLLETVFVPYGDADAMREAVDGATAAVILEPIQGEGGIRLPPDDYLAAVRELCTQRGVLLIFDEVQTGLGRTGAMFGCDHAGVVPDVMCLGKALSGGVIPCAAFHSTDEIWKVFHPNPFYHTSTFGANPLATTAAAATIQTLREENLVENSAEMGRRFLTGLRKLWERFPELIRDVRGRGLLIGVETFSAERGESIAARVFERNMLVAYTLNKPEVIRIEPPLIITRELVDQALERFEDALREESEA
ncbi:MAG TPA: aminotransferase class III-fold pyridoxal phosphate-dependent enzyme [Pyrinomonadaceae bacterium]|jgi:putrescine aminotransferase|nr:aminotransferase class III-fold pyridoxal phosphate-dependent enzyme [Pyrinomonadaceae bacterium]